MAPGKQYSDPKWNSVAAYAAATAVCTYGFVVLSEVLLEAEGSAISPDATAATIARFVNLSILLTALTVGAAILCREAVNCAGQSRRLSFYAQVPFMAYLVYQISLHINQLKLVSLSNQCYWSLNHLDEDNNMTVVCPNQVSLTWKELQPYYDLPAKFFGPLIAILILQSSLVLAPVVLEVVEVVKSRYSAKVASYEPIETESESDNLLGEDVLGEA